METCNGSRNSASGVRSDAPTFEVLTAPNAEQQRAFALLQQIPCNDRNACAAAVPGPCHVRTNVLSNASNCSLDSTLRTVMRMRASILSSVMRIVAHCACASDVPARPRRRSAASSEYATEEKVRLS